MSVLIERFDAVLSDLDGVVYAGPDSIPHAIEALQRLEDDGVGLAYVTNNASRSPASVAEHLRELGAPATENNVVSSAQAGARLLAREIDPGSRVLVTGSAYLSQQVQEAGLVPVNTENVDDGDYPPAAVIQGFDPSIGWKDLAEAAYAINAGARWIATNTDRTIPRDRGIAPGNGTLVAAVRAAVDVDPLVAGKPESPLFIEAARALNANDPLVVGDRLDTDILGGNRAGMTTALVLTGVDSPRTAIAIEPDQRPDLILNNLSELFTEYPAVDLDGDSAHCRNETAELDGEQLRLSTDTTDAWRAGCALWWSRHPNDAATPDVVVS